MSQTTGRKFYEIVETCGCVVWGSFAHARPRKTIISDTDGCFFSIRISEELSTPVVVQHQSHLPICPLLGMPRTLCTPLFLWTMMMLSISWYLNLSLINDNAPSTFWRRVRSFEFCVLWFANSDKYYITFSLTLEKKRLDYYHWDTVSWNYVN